MMVKQSSRRSTRDIYFTGDIHGEFVSFLFAVTRRYGFHDCAVIVCGDIGMGFHKLNYYVDTFRRMNKKLIDENIELYFVRGNHDDPSYFNATPDVFDDFTNIHLVRDYTVLHINNHNILCVGGASSVDKKFRVKDVSWWEFENVLPYGRLDCTDIDTVVTHCAPMFCNPAYERISWMDDELDEKSRGDRKLLNDVYFDLIASGNKVKYWFYGHYHAPYSCELSNVADDFSELDKSYLYGGQTLEDGKHGPASDDVCTFIGLDMLDHTKMDYFKYVE